jgi:hypothetical protein
MKLSSVYNSGIAKIPLDSDEDEERTTGREK